MPEAGFFSSASSGSQSRGLVVVVVSAAAVGGASKNAQKISEDQTLHEKMTGIII